MGQLDLRIDCLIFFRTDEFCKMLAVKKKTAIFSSSFMIFYIPMIPFYVGIVKQKQGSFFFRLFHEICTNSIPEQQALGKKAEAIAET